MRNNKTIIIMFLGIATLALADTALASTGASGLGYETALQTFADSITGPVAFTVGVLGMAASGMGLLFGGELTSWIRTSLFVILVIGFIVCAASIFEKFYGVSAAIIA